MTARIKRTFEFVAGVHISSEVYMTNYSVEIEFIVNTGTITEQNIAMDRVKYFISEKLDNSIFILQSDTDNIQKLLDTNINLVLLPEEPYDQMIAVMLMAKVNAILENRLLATDITLQSRLSDDVTFIHSIEEGLGPFEMNGWWNENSPNTVTKPLKSKSKKIVKLTKCVHTWEELDLSWVETKKQPNSAEVVFVEFEQKTDK
jgi:hypothetical protein